MRLILSIPAIETEEGFEIPKLNQLDKNTRVLFSEKDFVFLELQESDKNGNSN